MFIIIVFWLGSDKPLGLLFFSARFASLNTLSSFLPPSSVSLSYLILAVPMR